MKYVALAAFSWLGCAGAGGQSASDSDAGRSQNAAERCVQYGFTRVLPGSGLDASVADDGTIVAVSESLGLHQATVLDRAGALLGAFELDPFSAVVRAGARGEVVAAAADGRIRRFAADGSVVWTAKLGLSVSDLEPLEPGGALVSAQTPDGHGRLSYLDDAGNVDQALAVRAAAFLALDAAGAVVLTSRDLCRVDAPCGTGFDPHAPTPPSAPAGDGTETSAVVLLDPSGQTTGGFISSVNTAAPVGPLFIRSGLTSAGIVVLAKAVAPARTQTSADMDPGVSVALREVDTDAAPDRLLAFSGRTLVWDMGFEPLDDSGRAYVVGLFANRQGIALDVNGDVYKTHHLLQLSPEGRVRLRYDEPNDGIANDVRLAGMDGSGRIVLSGRFDGTRDFNPGTGDDSFTASPEARRYVTSVSACAER